MVSRAASSEVDRVKCPSDRCSNANRVAFLECRLEAEAMSGDCTVMILFVRSDFLGVRRFLAL